MDSKQHADRKKCPLNSTLTPVTICGKDKESQYIV